MTHRDITKVLPSVCALMTALSAPMTDVPDPLYFGALTTDEWEHSLQRTLAHRDNGNEDRFHDVQFADMQTDPVGAVRALYTGLGRELRPETADLMSAWWAEESADRAGQRRYDPATYGLDLDDIKQRFAFYGDRFTPDGG